MYTQNYFLSYESCHVIAVESDTCIYVILVLKAVKQYILLMWWLNKGFIVIPIRFLIQ